MIKNEKKQYLVLLLLLFLINSSLSLCQKSTSKENYSIIECLYEYRTITPIDQTLSKAVDSIAKAAKQDTIRKTYQTILQMNASKSQFMDYPLYVKDSIMNLNTGNRLSFDSINWLEMRYGLLKMNNSFFEIINKDRIGKSMTVIDRVGDYNYQYQDAMDDMEWKITDDSLVVGGYKCNKATTDFRGRNWIVWFTFDIPISDGPWKLSGLPGLILQAEDSRGVHSFVISSIRQRANSFGIRDKSVTIKIDRNRFMKLKYRFESAESQTVKIPSEVMSLYTGIKIDNIHSVRRTTYRLGCYSPLELN